MHFIMPRTMHVLTTGDTDRRQLSPPPHRLQAPPSLVHPLLRPQARLRRHLKLPPALSARPMFPRFPAHMYASWRFCGSLRFVFDSFDLMCRALRCASCIHSRTDHCTNNMNIARDLAVGFQDTMNLEGGENQHLTCGAFDCEGAAKVMVSDNKRAKGSCEALSIQPV